MTLKPSRTQTKPVQTFRDKIACLAGKATLLSGKESFEERDVAQADDYAQQYIDILDEILDSTIIIKTDVVALLDGNDTIRFKNADALSSWLTEHV
jgi:hypothetical protein